MPLLAEVARRELIAAPALDGLAALVNGKIEPERWTATITDPSWLRRQGAVRAA